MGCRQTYSDNDIFRSDLLASHEIHGGHDLCDARRDTMLKCVLNHSNPTRTNNQQPSSMPSSSPLTVPQSQMNPGLPHSEGPPWKDYYRKHFKVLEWTAAHLDCFSTLSSKLPHIELMTIPEDAGMVFTKYFLLNTAEWSQKGLSEELGRYDKVPVMLGAEKKEKTRGSYTTGSRTIPRVYFRGKPLILRFACGSI